MNNIIVGSTALHLNQLKKEPPKTDYDVWCSDVEQFNSVKDHPHQYLNRVDAVQMSEEILDCFDTQSKRHGVASINDLYTIKMSHLGYDIFWWKHVQSMLFMQERLGAILNQKLYDALKTHWKTVHTPSRLSLYKSKKDFFDDAVTKTYEHDYLHECVSYPNKPIYQSVLKDGEEVFVDNKKCDTMGTQRRIDMFREEVTVIALERWIIPQILKGENPNLIVAWNDSLRKTVTALTKGESQEFMIFNLIDFLKPSLGSIDNALRLLKLKE